MRLKTNLVLSTAASVVALAACSTGTFAKDRKPDRGVSELVPMAEETPQLGAPFVVNGKTYTPKDDVTHDEVGQAGVIGNWASSGLASSMVAIVHRTLPIPSYVELTHLDTGKTILARVVDRGPYSNDRIADVSPAAAELLGASGLSPLRVRRVNPAMAERAALRQGRAAGARLDTTPALLTALRRKFSENGAPVASQSDAPAAAVPPKAVVAKARPAPRAPSKRGADFETAPAGPAPMASVPAGQRKGRFIIERTGGHSAAPAPVAAEPSIQPPAPIEQVAEQPVVKRSGSWFVQIGAFADQGYAQTMAEKAGADLYEAGDIWRVRMGPFASRDDANASLGQIRNKGYPNARVTR